MDDRNNEQKSTSKPEIDGLTDQDLMAVTGGSLSLNFTKIEHKYSDLPPQGGGPQQVWVGCAWVTM